MGFKTRKIEASDLPVVALLEEELFDSPWSQEVLCSTYEQNVNDGWVLLDEGKIIGYLWYSFLLDESELLRIGVQTSEQGHGAGSFLLEAYLKELASQCSKFFLEVSENNKKAIQLYEKAQYKPYLTRKNYYSDGSDALLYVKENYEKY